MDIWRRSRHSQNQKFAPPGAMILAVGSSTPSAIRWALATAGHCHWQYLQYLGGDCQRASHCDGASGAPMLAMPLVHAATTYLAEVRAPDDAQEARKLPCASGAHGPARVVNRRNSRRAPEGVPRGGEDS